MNCCSTGLHVFPRQRLSLHKAGMLSCWDFAHSKCMLNVVASRAGSLADKAQEVLLCSLDLGVGGAVCSTLQNFSQGKLGFPHSL